MAIIVNPNPNLLSVDNWALVSGTTVINTILDTTLDMQTSPDLKLYDYVVDYTMQGQAVAPGYIYNAQGNTFMAPPPPAIDWESIVQNDFINVMQDLIQVVYDSGPNGGSMTSQQLNTAYQAALEDVESSFTPNQLALMQTIYNYVLGGG